MNYEDCIKITINETVADIFDRLPLISPEDRWALLMEHLEDVACDLDMDDVLIVPNSPVIGFQGGITKTAEFPHVIGILLVVGDNDAAVTGCDVFGVFRRVRCDIGDFSDRPTFIDRAHRFCGVIYDGNIVFFSKSHQRVEIATHPI